MAADGLPACRRRVGEHAQRRARPDEIGEPGPVGVAAVVGDGRERRHVRQVAAGPVVPDGEGGVRAGEGVPGGVVEHVHPLSLAHAGSRRRTVWVSVAPPEHDA
ncbi:hypothetical protein ACRAWC_16445 [Leifsonia sp. L25]|uniref:hypothetical protein n=1 Tax=Leifsonia sp. L25 TaxID=3423957 RepID=UPI003D68840F